LTSKIQIAVDTITGNGLDHPNQGKGFRTSSRENFILWSGLFYALDPERKK